VRKNGAIRVAGAAIALIFAASCARSGSEKPKIGVSLRSFDDPGSAAVRRAIESEAMDKAYLAIVDGQGRKGVQALQVDSFLERKLGAIALEAADPLALGEIIAKAKNVAVPIVFLGPQPLAETMRSWDKLYFVGSREADAGTAQAEILAEKWLANAKTAGRAAGAVLRYSVVGDAAAWDRRSAAFENALTKEGIKAIQVNEKAEAYICSDLASTLAMAKSLEAKGGAKNPASPLAIGFCDSEMPVILAAALSSGILAGAVISEPATRGKAVFALAYALARKSDPVKAAADEGFKIEDAKYIFIPYRIFPVAPPARAPAPARTK
jgi:methyl-galactoside transport system substrate-binding protein